MSKSSANLKVELFVSACGCRTAKTLVPFTAFTFAQLNVQPEFLNKSKSSASPFDFHLSEYHSMGIRSSQRSYQQHAVYLVRFLGHMHLHFGIAFIFSLLWFTFIDYDITN